MRLGSLITLVVCTFAASATLAEAQSASFGVKAGFVSATVKTSGTGTFEPEAEITGSGGAFVGFDVARHLRIQPEVLISWRRFSIKDSPAGISVKTSGVEVPILFQVPLTDTGRIRPLLYAGPQFSRLSTVKQRVFEIESDISDRIKNLEIGMAIGGGIEIEAGRGAITLDVRGTVGFTQLSEDRMPEVKSRAFLAFAGYRF